MPRKKTAKKAHMSDETFAELMESASQALQYERGAREGYRVTQAAIPKPPRMMSCDEMARQHKTPRSSC